MEDDLTSEEPHWERLPYAAAIKYQTEPGNVQTEKLLCEK